MFDDAGAIQREAAARACPVCDATGGSAIEANLDLARLDRHSFAARKVPELMHWRLVGCPRCDTLYASPAPPESVLQHAYEAADYDSGEAAAHAARTYSRLLGRLLERVPGDGGALDVGAGDGSFLRELLRVGIRDVVGVEPSPAALRSAADDVRPFLRQGMFRGQEAPVGTLRLVTAFQTLEHVADPLALCRSARRLLRPGGALAIVCHDRRAPLNRALGRRSPIFDVQHLQLFSRASLRFLLHRAGFDRIEVHGLVNRYPLRAWARYVPVPDTPKRRLLTALQGRAGDAAVSLRVGNVVAVGYRGPAPRSARNT